MTLVMIWDYLGSLVDQMASAGTAGRSAGLCLLCSQHICISCCTLSWQLSLFFLFLSFFLFFFSPPLHHVWCEKPTVWACCADERSDSILLTGVLIQTSNCLQFVSQHCDECRMSNLYRVFVRFHCRGKEKKEKRKKKKKRKPRRPRAVRHQKSTICRKISSDTSGPGTGPTPPAAVCKTNTKIRR